MPYTEQQWHDDTTTAPYGPINGTRLNYMEAGIGTAQATAEAALAAGGGGGIGTALPLVDGSASAGVGTVSSAVDHVHPTDTSRAPLASPTFTGSPVLPTGTTGTTQSAADSTTKLATTAFVTTADNLKANLASPTFTGSPVLPTGTTGSTQSANDNSTKLATTAYADTIAALKANLASPTFSGTVTLPAAVAGNPTFSGTVTLPTGTVTSGMILDGTILNADVNSSAAIAASKVVQPIVPGVYNCISPILAQTTATMQAAVVTTLLVPTFHMILPPGPSYVVSQLGVRVGTGVAASTIGAAIYSITWTGTGTFTMSLVGQLNAALSGVTGAVFVQGDVTSGAAGSGASTVTLDFTANKYMIGAMASTATTLTIDGVASVSHLGSLVQTTAARSSTTDWPATYTDSVSPTAGAIGNTNRLNAVSLINADGKNYL